MAQVGSASALGAEGRRFKSGYPDGVQTRSALLHPVGEPDAGRASVCGEGRAATASTASGYPDNIMPTACSAAPPT